MLHPIRNSIHTFPKVAGYSSLLFVSKLHSGWMRAMDSVNSKQPKLEGTGKKTYVTRRDVNEEVKENREKYVNMPLSEKRKLYKKKKFVVLDEIPTWQQQAPDIMRKFTREQLEPLLDVSERLNNKISLWQGDITTLEIDAIVNAANRSLLGGGGVDGAIHASAGYKLREECATINPCDTGDAKITAGYNLPAKYIIHTVGPIGINAGKLASCYKRSLEIVKREKLRTVAFPCISTGIYGYDIEKATPVVMTTIRKWLTDNHEHIERILFCVFLSKDVEVYENNLLQHFPIVKSGPKEKKAKKEPKAEKAEKHTADSQTVRDNTADRKTKDSESESSKKCPSKPSIKVGTPKVEDSKKEINRPKHEDTTEGKHITRSKANPLKQTTLDGFVTKAKGNKSEKNGEVTENTEDITDTKKNKDGVDEDEQKISASPKL